MTEFPLIDILNSNSQSFNDLLKSKLQSSNDTDSTFNNVRCLFRTAAQALDFELKNRRQQSDNNTICNGDIQSHCHWIPGRIEVMGKHTDYAGGNSLVCATTGRGMAMVSTFLPNKEDSNDSTMKITIISVLPRGLEHHATLESTASYQVDDNRPVVHHTIHIPNNSQSNDKSDSKVIDWTIYPTAIINRLHKNFGLYPHSSSPTDKVTETKTADDIRHVLVEKGKRIGGHVFIALSSNLPPASGLSTSSAFVTGLFLVLNSHLKLSETPQYCYAIGKDEEDDTIYNLSTYLGNAENGMDYISTRVREETYTKTVERYDPMFGTTEKETKTWTSNEPFVLEGTINGGVGTFGGSEDHAAILTGKSGELRLLSFCPTRQASIDMKNVVNDLVSLDIGADINMSMEEMISLDSIIQLPDDLAFVVAFSGARAEKAGCSDGDTDASLGYNNASDLARKSFQAYYTGCSNNDIGGQTLADAIRYERKCRGETESVKTHIQRGIQDRASLLAFGSSNKEEYTASLATRFEQFYDESECLVPAAAYAISQIKLDLLGSIVDASHRGAVNLLRNQITETAWLPLWARGIEADLQLNPLLVKKPSSTTQTDVQPNRIKAIASSAFGAGFGGSCWALVYRHQAEEFTNQWQKAYDERFPGGSETREFFVTSPGPGAFCL